MSKRRFEQQMGTRESVEKNLKDAGYESPQEVIENREGTRDRIEGLLEGKDVSYLLNFLGESRKKEDAASIEKFSKTEDSLERLEILRTLSLPDAIRCLKSHASSEAQWRYLEGRLDFYQKLLQGKATRRYTSRKWDSKKREYVDVEKEERIAAPDATPETIRLGILRDTMFAAMIGTPEMAVFKIADKRLKESGTSRTHMPELKGYHSGIHERSIGYAYPFLRDIYQKARKQVEKKAKDQDVDVETLEHRAVIMAANWLEEAMNYNDPGRSQHSPYASSIEEATAWTRLGDERVKAQLRGMRRKIQDSRLENIDRFIGKSGSNKYERERKRLYWQLKNFDQLVAADDKVFQQPHLQEYAYKLGDLDEKKKKKEITDEEYATQKAELDAWFEENKTNFLEDENTFAIKKQEVWRASETERLQNKQEKKIKEIESADLPEEEKEAQRKSIRAKYEKQLAEVEADSSEKIAYYQSRTAEQLRSDLTDRQALVEARYEKRKSLAQKALDLHFAFNHGRDYNDTTPTNIIDWINYAPLGTIKRAHKMLHAGINQEQIIKYSLTDIICGKRGVSREDLAQIGRIFDAAKAGTWEERQKLEAMMKVGNILALSKCEASLSDIEAMSQQNFYGMTPALKEFSLEEVRGFMDRGINLNSIVTAKKVTEKYGHKLEADELAEMASHNIDGLEDAFRTFELAAVKTLLKDDVHLPTAVAVLNNTKQFGYELSVDQIAKVAKNVSDVGDFTDALRGLPLDEVEKLFSSGLSYQNFGIVKSALERHRLDSAFNSTLAVAQKLVKNDEFSDLDGALEFYSLQGIERIIAKDVPLSGMLQIRQTLEEKQVAADFEETILFTKAADRSYWNFGQCIDTFGIENVRKMAAKSCSLSKALEVNRYINGESRRSRWGGEQEEEMSDSTREALRKGGVDVIIAIAKAGSIEAAVKTLAAGFTVEEVTRFPYLISSLVSKP